MRRRRGPAPAPLPGGRGDRARVGAAGLPPAGRPAHAPRAAGAPAREAVVAVIRAGLGAAVAALAVMAAPSAAAGATCAARQAGGGEWRSFGHDAANSRFQERGGAISPARAALLAPAWRFSTTRAGGTGDVTGTPIVAAGCVYAATTQGWVFALD